MSVTRLEKIGTIFSRVKASLESGVLKPEYKPMWYEVYTAIPPQHEPRYDRAPGVSGPLPKILYPEDRIRAAYYKQIGNTAEVIDLHQPSCNTIANKFIEAFQKNESPDLTFEENLVAAADVLELEGISLRSMDMKAALSYPAREFREDVGHAQESRREITEKFSFVDLFDDAIDEKIPEANTEENVKDDQ